jgi:nitrilase
VVVIGSDGEIVNRHRKLMPTNPERMVWGQGDASGLKVAETAVGRVGSLICWENYMPLARFALYAEGVEIYVAGTWDEGDTWISTMRHIAAEGRCWVVGAGCSLRSSDIPADFPGRDQLFPDPDEWLNPGDSVVAAPGGELVAGPLHQEHGLLLAEVEPAAVQPRTARSTSPATTAATTSSACPSTAGQPRRSPSRLTRAVFLDQPELEQLLPYNRSGRALAK